MTKYDIMFESIQNKLDSGEITAEDAKILNDVAYEKYADDDTEYELAEESCDDSITYGDYLEAMEYELFDDAYEED